MAVASCLREFLGLHQGCGSSVCHFSLLVIISFFSQCFIKILHGIVIVTFLIVHVCYTYSCIGSRVNLIHVLRCLEVNFAFVALHQFQDVQCLLQESGVSLACFHLRTIDILQRFTISYTTLNEHGHEVILDSLQVSLLSFLGFSSKCVICILGSINIILEKLVGMIIISLYLLHGSIQEIVQHRTFGTTLFSMNRFFQPIISRIKVRSRSELKIIHSFGTQGISHTRHTLHSLTNEFRNVLHSQIIYIHQLIKILLVISRISILNLTQETH